MTSPENDGGNHRALLEKVLNLCQRRHHIAGTN